MKNYQQTILCLLLAAVLVLALAACGGKQEPAVPDGGVTVAGDSIDIDNLALRPDGEAGLLYENDGLKLLIPLEYDERLITETPENDERGVLFTVSEKASVEAAKAQSENYDGAGRLFSIGRIDEAALREMLCYDRSGAEIFARGGDGSYYVFYHPTDVRYFREDNEAMARDQEQWTELTGWAWDSVRSTFLAENDGLTAVEYADNLATELLARAAYQPDAVYTVSTLEFGPLEPAGVDPAPYVERLICNAVFESIDPDSIPGGEYVVLSYPEEDFRVDFLLIKEANYVRVVQPEFETLYKVTYPDETIHVGDVMEEWYHALAEQNQRG